MRGIRQSSPGTFRKIVSTKEDDQGRTYFDLECGHRIYRKTGDYAVARKLCRQCDYGDG